MFSCKFAAYFRNTFLQEHMWKAASDIFTRTSPLWNFLHTAITFECLFLQKCLLISALLMRIPKRSFVFQFKNEKRKENFMHPNNPLYNPCTLLCPCINDGILIFYYFYGRVDYYSCSNNHLIKHFFRF